jgi:predicted RNA polymerase sigma factor
MSVAARKAEADELFRAGRHQEAVLAYGGALSLAEERRDASLLHLLYANR